MVLFFLRYGREEIMDRTVTAIGLRSPKLTAVRDTDAPTNWPILKYISVNLPYYHSLEHNTVRSKGKRINAPAI